MRKFFGFLIAAFTASSCASYTDGIQTPPASTVAVQKVSQDVAAIVGSNTAFAVDIYQRLRVTEPEDNLFVSPASISAAFGLAYAGAKGATKEELGKVLHFDRLPADVFHQAMGKLLPNLEVSFQPDSKVSARVSINNALWFDELTVLEKPYAKLTADHYSAGDYRVDYRKNPQAARETINEWVEEKTGDRIKDLLGEGDVGDTTRSILVNTIYMKASWRRPFLESKTVEEEFHRIDGTKVKRSMMNQIESFKHWQNGRLQALEMPYYGDVSMVVLLPKRKGDLPALEEALTETSLSGWLTHLAASPYVKVDLKLPAIKLKTKYSMVGEGRILTALGMKLPFSDAADFSGAVRAERQPDGFPFKLDGVIHQTFLEIDEKGTEAAAATAIAGIVVTSARRGPPPPPPIPFYADHPYVFMIKDDKTGMILFMGRVLEPAA